MDSLYRDILHKETRQTSPQDSEAETTAAYKTVCDHSESSQTDLDQSEDVAERQSEARGESGSSVPPGPSLDTSKQQCTQDGPGPTRPAALARIELKQPIGSLRGAARAEPGGPLTVRGEIETITDKEILQNRESEEGIRSIPRFRNYQPGKPSKVPTPGSHGEDPDGSSAQQTLS